MLINFNTPESIKLDYKSEANCLRNIKQNSFEEEEKELNIIKFNRN